MTITRQALIMWVPYKNLVPLAYEDPTELKSKFETMFGPFPIVLSKSDLPVLKAWREVDFELTAINDLIEGILIHETIEVNSYESLLSKPLDIEGD